eukprot:m.491875 g.491875  ORF g.491875 m.491875 type:complete len:1860 (-) comp57272_c1_seq3:128-5707(-)
MTAARILCIAVAALIAGCSAQLPSGVTCASIMDQLTCNGYPQDCSFDTTTRTCVNIQCSQIQTTENCAAKNCNTRVYQTASVGNVSVCYNGTVPQCSQLSFDNSTCTSNNCTFYSDAFLCTSGLPPCSAYTSETDCAKYSATCNSFTASAGSDTIYFCYAKATGLDCSRIPDQTVCNAQSNCAYSLSLSGCLACANTSQCTAIRNSQTTTSTTVPTTRSPCSSLLVVDDCNSRSDCRWNGTTCGVCPSAPCAPFATTTTTTTPTRTFTMEPCTSITDAFACSGRSDCYFNNGCHVCTNPPCVSFTTIASTPMTTTTTPGPTICTPLNQVNCQNNPDCKWSNDTCSVAPFTSCSDVRATSICLSYPECFLFNSTCYPCMDAPCSTSVNCSGYSDSTKCVYHSNACKPVESNFGFNFTCAALDCSDLPDAASCSARANCASVGSGSTFLCYTINTVIPCLRRTSSSVCTDSRCSWDSASSLCYNTSLAFPCTSVTSQSVCGAKTGCTWFSATDPLGQPYGQCYYTSQGPVCSSITSSSICANASNCTFSRGACWSCPSSSCVVPTTTTYGTTTTTTTTTTVTTTTLAPIDCSVDQWTNVGFCSLTCGGGVQSRVRSVVTPSQHNGAACPPLVGTISCSTQACPVDCQVSSWVDGACSASCAGGTYTRSRTITTNPAAGGVACPNLNETLTCNTGSCPSAAINCTVSDWVSGSCSVTCGNGVTSRSRFITRNAENGGAPCPSLTDTVSCIDQVCAVNCVVGNWVSTGSCSATCGSGIRSQSRTVTTPAAGTGIPCPALTETISCNTAACPIDCQVADWVATSACSLTCGNGTQSFARSVLVEASNGGRACPPLTETLPCNTEECPVDCLVGSWSAFGSCSTTCGNGAQSQTRTIVQNAAYGGLACPNLVNTQACTNPAVCVVNCLLSSWEFFGSCSLTCNTGIQVRTRTIVEAAQNGGTPCPPTDDLFDNVPCNTNNCPIDCTTTDWSLFSECSTTCGPGVNSRSRVLVAPAEYGGHQCGALAETQVCMVTPCTTTTTTSTTTTSTTTTSTTTTFTTTTTTVTTVTSTSTAITTPSFTTTTPTPTAVSSSATTMTTSTTTPGSTTTEFINACLAFPCDPLSSCTPTNVSGGYTCSPCPAGYTGDPRVKCTDIDECASDPCIPPRVCTNSLNPLQPDFFECSPCPEGYLTVNATACEKIEPCASNPCDPLTNCTESGLSFECSPCPPGFTGSGNLQFGGCQDINECEEFPAPCVSESNCTNTRGSFYCSGCPSGYMGDGYASANHSGCSLIPTCHANSCDPLTSCFQPGPGVFDCTACPSGYSSASGTGTTPCRPVNCSAVITLPPGATANCTSISYTSTCTAVCASGYSGASSTYTCDATGSWNTDARINCTAIEQPSCAALTSLPAHSVIRLGNRCVGKYLSDDYCILDCVAGYTGTASLACGANGTWVGGLTCVACPTNQYQPLSGQQTCNQTTQCILGTSYQIVAPTLSTDRVCKPTTSPCNSATSFESRSATLTSDRACSPLAVCVNGQYISTPSTTTSNRVCSDCQGCGAGLTARPGSCQSSSTSNTDCVPCTQCAEFEYAITACQSFSDRQCRQLTVCPPGYPEAFPPSASTDRTCSKVASNPSDLPASNDTIYVLATAVLKDVPNALDSEGRPTTTFLTVFTAAVQNQLVDLFGYVSVVVFKVKAAGNRRATGSVQVEYRVDAKSSNVVSTTALQQATQNNAQLTLSLQDVAADITSDDYSKTSATSTSASVKQYSASGNTKSSSSNTGTIVGASVGVVVGVILVTAIIMYIFRADKKDDIDLTGDMDESDSRAQSSGQPLELAEIVPTRSHQERRQMTFYSSIRIQDDFDESGA